MSFHRVLLVPIIGGDAALEAHCRSFSDAAVMPMYADNPRLLEEIGSVLSAREAHWVILLRDAERLTDQVLQRLTSPVEQSDVAFFFSGAPTESLPVNLQFTTEGFKHTGLIMTECLRFGTPALSLAHGVFDALYLQIALEWCARRQLLAHFGSFEAVALAVWMILSARLGEFFYLTPTSSILGHTDSPKTPQKLNILDEVRRIVTQQFIGRYMI